MSATMILINTIFLVRTFTDCFLCYGCLLLYKYCIIQGRHTCIHNNYSLVQIVHSTYFHLMAYKTLKIYTTFEARIPYNLFMNRQSALPEITPWFILELIQDMMLNCWIWPQTHWYIWLVNQDCNNGANFMTPVRPPCLTLKHLKPGTNMSNILHSFFNLTLSVVLHWLSACIIGISSYQLHWHW